jgi:hypothetical protein
MMGCSRTGTAHLFSSVIAVAVTTATLLGGWMVAIHLEHLPFLFLATLHE